MHALVENFYRDSMDLLERAQVPFLVSGSYSLRIYTGIVRNTKDIDIFLRERDVDRALEAFANLGYRTEKTEPHWLAKAWSGDDFVDLIFRAGNGLCDVDDSWFARARESEILGKKIKMAAPEEMIRMKAYIMERERFDGADVAHLLKNCGAEIDWQHLLNRFGDDWPVLLGHLILFRYVYPSERRRVPDAVMENLLARLPEKTWQKVDRLCRGTLLSRVQYLYDVNEDGFRDARPPHAIAQKIS